MGESGSALMVSLTATAAGCAVSAVTAVAVVVLVLPIVTGLPHVRLGVCERKAGRQRMARPAPEVDMATYEIVGTVERYDMRDSAGTRFELKAGTPAYQDYYSRHPEKKESDDETRRLAASARQSHREIDPVNTAFRAAVYYPRTVLGQRPYCEGTDTGNSEPRVETDPVAMTRKLKSFGRYLGAGNVRITKAKQEWVFTHWAESYEPGAYGKPVDFDYENLVYMVFPHGRNGARLLGNGIGVSANIEAGRTYSTATAACVVMAYFVRSLGWRARALPPGWNMPVLHVPNAVNAGLGEQGRTCHLVTKEFGNAVRLGAVATDMPVVLDKPVDFGLQDFCEKCHLCADYCPSGCIRHNTREVVRGVKRWAVDGDKCRHYRARIGGNCNICMAVCPWSHPNTVFHDTIRELAQSLPWLRDFLVQCEKVFYNKGKGGQYRRVSAPEWVTSKATKAASKTGSTGSGVQP